MKYIALIVFSLFSVNSLLGQTSDTPLPSYNWKGGKTAGEPGYVILKSGKKLEGTISLKGTRSNVSEVRFEGDGKKIDFPVTALSNYGLTRPSQNQTFTTKTSGPVSDSPASMYEWRNMGTVMDKVIETSEPREGYVILKDGSKVEGILKLKRKDGILTNYEVKGASKKKIKGDISEVARYGYSVSAESVAQENLADMASKFSRGTLNGQQGEISQINIQGKFYSKKVVFRANAGQLSEHTPKDTDSFTQFIDGNEKKFIAVEDTFVEEEFNGATFQFYRNPFPTTINKFATNIAKAGVQAGTSAAAQAAVKKDAKDQGYVSNMDSVIAVSSKEELIGLRDNLVNIGGYSSSDQLMENSDNESLKNNVSALNLAIAGKEAAESEGGIYNKEWIILNKKTGEKTVVYKSDYKQLVEPLLKGCYEYLTLSKSEQKTYEKWNSKMQMLGLLDGCY